MVSVVIPAYNVEKYIAHCLDCVLKQSYTELEIILVDDGSPDSSGKICDEYAKRDARVKVLHRENGGLSAARNSGIDVATGSYITFVDSDDFLLPDIILHAVQLAQKECADIVAWQNVRCEENHTLQDVVLAARPETVKSYNTQREKMQHFLIGKEIGTMAWGKLYRTSLFENVRYPVGKYHEDVFTTYQLIHLAQKIVSTSEIGYIYRKNAESITAEAFSERRLNSIEGKLLQAEFIEREYPELVQPAYAGIIYACNQCLLQIGRSSYRKRQTLSHLQRLYRRYGRYYLREKVSGKGKLFALAAMLHVRLAIIVSKVGV